MIKYACGHQQDDQLMQVTTVNRPCPKCWQSSRQARLRPKGSNFRQYWREHLGGHLLPPLACSTIAVVGGTLIDPVLAVVAIQGPCQLLRQAVGFWEKRDTASIDMMWIVSGMAAGFIGGALCLAALRAIGGIA